MDTQGFRAMLAGRGVPDEKIPGAVALAERFERYVQESGGEFSTESVWAFSRSLIEACENTEENFITLARFGWFVRNDAVFVAFVESLDGGEAHENLYRRVEERFGTALRDEVFAGIGVAPFGTPTPEKARYMQSVIERLERAVGADRCRALLADSLRDLPEASYAGERDAFTAAEDVDGYLLRRKERFLEQLDACRREGRLFFAQEITDEVLAFVRDEPEMGGGKRVGNVVYEVKIPYMTREYLHETDERLKRYFYCHCPWAREAVKRGDPVVPIFCNCSAGFHKRPWEVIFGQPIRVDVLENVLQGDMRCRFAIHLPE